MKRTPLKRSRKPIRSNDGRDWARMSGEAHSAAKGLCEWCGLPLPFGTPAAHIIPRDKNHPEYDEAWNLALLGFIPPCTCHTVFDRSRPRAVISMRSRGTCRLIKRIEADERLKTYMDEKIRRWQFKMGQIGLDNVYTEKHG